MSFYTGQSRRVSAEVLQKMGTAVGTDTHRPISHWDAFDRTACALASAGWKVTSQQHAVNSRNEETGLWDQYFGLMELEPNTLFRHDGAAQSLGDEAKMLAGVRNAHNKRFPYGCVFGARIMVCDNLQFHGEVEGTRRHTKNIEADLDEVIRRGVEMFTTMPARIHRRFESYKAAQLSVPQVNDIVVRSWREYDAIPKTLADNVLDEYHEPSYEEHKQYDDPAPEYGSVWRLYNAFTEALKVKGGLLSTLSGRTMRLHKLLDKSCGMAA